MFTIGDRCADILQDTALLLVSCFVFRAADINIMRQCDLNCWSVLFFRMSLKFCSCVSEESKRRTTWGQQICDFASDSEQRTSARRGRAACSFATVHSFGHSVGRFLLFMTEVGWLLWSYKFLCISRIVCLVLAAPLVDPQMVYSVRCGCSVFQLCLCSSSFDSLARTVITFRIFDQMIGYWTISDNLWSTTSIGYVHRLYSHVLAVCNRTRMISRILFAVLHIEL